MSMKMKGLLKGLRYISTIFDEEQETEMQIGFPTDVKHVAHIGWDGPTANSPSWLINKMDLEHGVWSKKNGSLQVRTHPLSLPLERSPTSLGDRGVLTRLPLLSNPLEVSQKTSSRRKKTKTSSSRSSTKSKSTAPPVVEFSHFSDPGVGGGNSSRNTAGVSADHTPPRRSKGKDTCQGSLIKASEQEDQKALDDISRGIHAI
uniref:CRIB domain-containing protein n=1 Tax=Chenopodium quinoa TaxID=63459 RepID=A0A803KT03_CHEQI